MSKRKRLIKEKMARRNQRAKEASIQYTLSQVEKFLKTIEDDEIKTQILDRVKNFLEKEPTWPVLSFKKFKKLMS